MKLGEEAAEFMALVNKSHYQGEPCTREQIRDELGDVLWALQDVVGKQKESEVEEG